MVNLQINQKNILIFVAVVVVVVVAYFALFDGFAGQALRPASDLDVFFVQIEAVAYGPAQVREISNFIAENLYVLSVPVAVPAPAKDWGAIWSDWLEQTDDSETEEIEGGVCYKSDGSVFDGTCYKWGFILDMLGVSHTNNSMERGFRNIRL